MKVHREAVKQLLRVERARAHVSFDQISERLKMHGISQSSANLRAKAARGQMEAGLFLALLDVLGVRTISVPNVIADLGRPQEDDRAPGADAGTAR